LSVSVHNPDQYMSALRTILAQGRKRIGLLVGAGGPAGMCAEDGTWPLIPAVVGLTEIVLNNLKPTYGGQIDALCKELKKKNIETVLSRVRSLGLVIGTTEIYGLNGDGYKTFGEKICSEIGNIVNVRLPKTFSPYSNIINWIVGTARDNPVEIFTTNYDFLFEEAFERVHAPYFDGFSGSHEPFFDPVSIARNDLPARWTRLWKLHGSLGWGTNDRGDVIRTRNVNSTHLIFPEYLKYDHIQKAPYAAMFDRLRSFLATSDTLLIAIGFSFADSHITACIDEALAGNPVASAFAFQFRTLDDEIYSRDLALRRPNFTVYAKDQAVVNGVAAEWKVSSELPTKDWGPIRASFWGETEGAGKPHFLLGSIDAFARFVAASRSAQALFSSQPNPDTVLSVGTLS
jgi:hypothetical protein